MSLRFVLFFPLSFIVTLFFKPAVVLFVAVNFIYVLKHVIMIIVTIL